MEHGIVSRCGIYCGACYVYRAQRDCGDFLRETAEKYGVELDKVKCLGCGAPAVEKWSTCRDCAIISCLDEKKHKYCTECEGFWDKKCDIYNRLTEIAGDRGEDIRTNLIKITDNPESWLKEMDKKWRCSGCGKPTSWYEENCHHCGKPPGGL